MVDLLDFIPETLKQQVADALVDFLALQAEKVTNEQVAGKIRKLSSKSEFAEAVEMAIRQGSQRFLAEYIDQDEDLTAAIAASPDFWNAKSVQTALLTLVKQPGAWTAPEYEQIAAHFATVANFADLLPERRNRERVDRAVTYFLRCVVEELWTLPGAKEVREVYALQFQKVSAEAAREQVALARQQLQATAQLSAEMRQALGQLTDLMGKHLLAAPALTALPTPRPFHNLPRPDYVRFIGREEELNWLRQRLSPQDRAWQIAVTGIGGVGKSALALAVAYEVHQNYDHLPPNERFEAIVWISAKEEVLTVQGKQPAALPETRLRTLEDVYTAIAQTLERPEIVRAQPEDQGRLVEKALREQRTLLIMDNLESVKDERLRPFLRNLPAPTKAIVTSREWLDVADVLILRGMSPEEAGELMQQEAQARHVKLTEHQQKRIYELTSGIPLPIRLAIARLSGEESFAAVERWLGDARGDLPEYCIAGQAELAQRSDPHARELLLACSLFDRTAGASRRALGEVADLSLADRDAGLARLQRLFLINRTNSDRFWVLPITERYAEAVFAQIGTQDGIVARWLEWCLRYARQKDVALRLHPKETPDFSREYPNLLSAIDWCIQHQKWDMLICLTENVWFYPYMVGLYAECQHLLEITQQALDQIAPGAPTCLEAEPQVYRGRLERWLGVLLWRKDLHEEAEVHLQTAEGILQAYVDQPALHCEIGRIYDVRADMFIRQHDYPTAEAAARRVLAIGEQTGSAELKALGAYTLARLATRQGQFAEADTWIEHGLTWAKEIRWQRMLDWMAYRRGRNAAEQGDYTAAEGYFMESLKSFEEWGDAWMKANILYHLGSVYQHSAQLDLARRTIDEACEIFERLGTPRKLEAVRRLRDEL